MEPKPVYHTDPPTTDPLLAYSEIPNFKELKRLSFAAQAIRIEVTQHENAIYMTIYTPLDRFVLRFPRATHEDELHG